MHRPRRTKLLGFQQLESRRVLNTAPVLDNTASLALAGISQDAVEPVGAVGTLVSALIDADGPLKNFSDWDGDMPGIAITATDLRGGTLWYSTNGGTTWLDVGVVSAAAPRLLAADASTRLAFQPAASFSGTISEVFSFKAWDRGWRPFWQRMGADLDGEAVLDQSGSAVALSADGTTIAIGARGNGGNGSTSGHTRVYRWSGDVWTQLGGDIDGAAAGDNAGSAVALSADGSIVAIGAPAIELLFTATFSESVFVAGAPTVTLTIGKIQRQAVYQSGSGSSSLVFRYTVQPGDAAPKGITIRNTIATADATLTDTAGNVAKLSFKPPSGQRVVIASALPGSLAAFTRW